mmetsp:Transcript_28804/g.67002  ORF Transcript_28804/g.67002 Transcript_28804/m.67002 type:complete len:1124 (+) Transcript_28804:89-3460(+)
MQGPSQSPSITAKSIAAQAFDNHVCAPASSSGSSGTRRLRSQIRVPGANTDHHEDRLAFAVIAALATPLATAAMRAGLSRPRPRRAAKRRQGQFSSLMRGLIKRGRNGRGFFGQAEDLSPLWQVRWQPLTPCCATDTEYGVQETEGGADATLPSQDEDEDHTQDGHNGSPNPSETSPSTGTDEDWTDRLRRTFHSKDWRGMRRLVVTMGRPHRKKANAIIVEEVLATSGEEALQNFCGMMKAFGLLRRRGLHKVDVGALWRSTKAWFEDQGPDLTAWTDMVKVLCNHRNDALEDAADILRQLEASSDSAPSADMYAHYIRAVGRLNGSSDAMVAFHHVLDQALTPSAECYSALVTVYAKEGALGVEQAKYWLRRAELALRAEHAGPALDTQLVRLYGDMMIGYSECGRLRDTFSILGMLKLRGLKPTSLVFLRLMRAAMSKSARGLEECRNILRIMVQMGVTPGLAHYNLVIKGYGSRGMLRSALALADRLRQNGMQWDSETYYGLIVATVNGSQPDEVEMSVKLLGQMRREGVPPRADHYILTIKGLGEAGYMGDASDIFMKLRSMGDLDPFAYDMMMRLHASYGEMESAMRVYNLMKEDRVEPRIVTFLFLVRGFLQAGLYTEALQFHPDFLAYRESLEAVLRDPNSSVADRKAAVKHLSGRQLRHWSLTYNFLIEAAELQENPPLVQSLLQEVVSKRIPFNTQKFASALAQADYDVRGAAISSKRGHPRFRLRGQSLEEWSRLSAQAKWKHQVPDRPDDLRRQSPVGADRAASGFVISPLGPSRWGKVRTRLPGTTGAAAKWYHPVSYGHTDVQVSAHLLSSAIPLLPEVQNGAIDAGPRLHGKKLFLACLSGTLVSIANAHAAVTEHFHATAHRRPMATLTMSWPGEAIVRTGQETQESLQRLFQQFGAPDSRDGPCYVFLSPELCNLDALVLLLAASSSYPKRIFLLRAVETKPKPPDTDGDDEGKRILSPEEKLVAQCRERGDAGLGQSLVTILKTLPAAVLVNGVSLITNSLRLGDMQVATFERDLQAALIGPRPFQSRQEIQESSSDWQAWLARSGLRQLVRCNNKTIRIDSLRHQTGWSKADLFRVRAVDNNHNKVVVDLWDSRAAGGLVEYES